MRTRRSKLLAIVLAVVVLAAGAVVVALGWLFSTRILTPAPYGLMPEFELIEVRPDGPDAYRIVLPLPDASADAAPPQMARTDVGGRYGLLWEGGAGRLGDVVARDEATVTRTVERTRGRAPRAGDPARVDVTVFGPDPSSLGLAFDEVRIPGPVGELPGWWLPGEVGGDSAVLVVHGRRRADRSEALRILPTLRESGASVLVASYRNHDASPPSPDGFYHYGASEVEDVEAALRWLAGRDVRRVALVGFSMGGSVLIGALLDWPEDGPTPVGLMLDSPLVDPQAVFVEAARDLGVPAPGPLAAWATRVAGWRAGVDFGALDRRRAAPELELPVLIVAGDGDGTVPIATIDAFAAALAEPPRYLRLEGVEHVEGWNAATERYERAVRDFLAEVGLGEVGPDEVDPDELELP